jgi:hypothetical protein
MARLVEPSPPSYRDSASSRRFSSVARALRCEGMGSANGRPSGRGTPSAPDEGAEVHSSESCVIILFCMNVLTVFVNSGGVNR